ncbi:MAG: hypothetical protein OXT67_12275 [Zetaproteobacteria bacterium]|nr:hypothetical protein [Zetaproteobacteria bacterium]
MQKLDPAGMQSKFCRGACLGGCSAYKSGIQWAYGFYSVAAAQAIKMSQALWCANVSRQSSERGG